MAHKSELRFHPGLFCMSPMEEETETETETLSCLDEVERNDAAISFGAIHA